MFEGGLDVSNGSVLCCWKVHPLKIMITIIMMTSSNGNIFRVTGHLCREFTGHKGQWRGALMFSLICTQITGWVNNGEAGDLRRHRAHYDVTIMDLVIQLHQCMHIISLGDYFTNVLSYIIQILLKISSTAFLFLCASFLLKNQHAIDIMTVMSCAEFCSNPFIQI